MMAAVVVTSAAALVTDPARTAEDAAEFPRIEAISGAEREQTGRTEARQVASAAVDSGRKTAAPAAETYQIASAEEVREEEFPDGIGDLPAQIEPYQAVPMPEETEQADDMPTEIMAIDNMPAEIMAAENMPAEIENLPEQAKAAAPAAETGRPEPQESRSGRPETQSSQAVSENRPETADVPATPIFDTTNMNPSGDDIMLPFVPVG